MHQDLNPEDSSQAVECHACYVHASVYPADLAGFCQHVLLGCLLNIGLACLTLPGAKHNHQGT